ncbi:hypothetical protein OJAV_G00193140 [Oryzias javanicus]|uniref:Uncharacterized protein n=1 Tax=Oryzias javanicus TaxID=123683 RepID=A0A3S2NUW7_ORYJA|nr:hypothetical protein OJAV_G00193140 [Oryzias javanicus]
MDSRMDRKFNYKPMRWKLKNHLENCSLEENMVDKSTHLMLHSSSIQQQPFGKRISVSSSCEAGSRMLIGLQIEL